MNGKQILVHMPDDSCLEVFYYYDDSTLDEGQRTKNTKLYIQLHDCISTAVVQKSLCAQDDELEQWVATKVINLKGHLC